MRENAFAIVEEKETKLVAMEDFNFHVNDYFRGKEREIFYTIPKGTKATLINLYGKDIIKLDEELVHPQNRIWTLKRLMANDEALKKWATVSE